MKKIINKIIKKIILKIKKEPKNKIDIYEGAISFKDKICPNYLNLENPKYLELDEMYYSGLIIYNYNREQEDIILKKLIDSNINMNISIFYEKANTQKAIKDLTYHIGNVGVQIKETSENRQDIEIAAFTYSDAKYLRKEIQINNQELFYLYIYIDIFTQKKEEINFILNKIENILQSSGLYSKKAYFRQEQVFLATMPFLENSIEIKNAAKRNVLTSGMCATYPFISSAIFDDEGIYIGNNIYNNSLVFIDRYNDKKYKNSNICIFGTSGAGKSFFTKLLILRSRLNGIEQFIIDPEREYTKLCTNLNGTLIKIGPNSETYINILDIRKESLEEQGKGYLETKILKLIGFFNLIFGEINEEERGILEEKIIKCYELKNINFEDKSLYKKEKNKYIFKTRKDMPILSDLYNILNNDNKTKIFAIKLKPFIKGSLKFFNNYTNVELNNNLIVADVYDLGEENLKYGMYIFTELFWDKIKNNRKIKKAIYLDEVWRLIGITSNKIVASFIYKIFKTIRKYGGSAVAITQDISDIFSLENGAYGKSILNNSEIKTFFSLEEDNIKILSKFSSLSEKEKIEIKNLKRGECLMFVGENHILVNIESDEFERRTII